MQTASETEIFAWLMNDFESAWECLASREDKELGRGNFTFALQATILLELVSRLCKDDPESLSDFARELNKLNPRYFIRLPGEIRGPRDFSCPILDIQRSNSSLSCGTSYGMDKLINTSRFPRSCVGAVPSTSR